MAERNTNSDVHLESLADTTYQQESSTLEGFEERQETAGQDLIPVDKGRAAWRILLSAFIFESLLWGKWTFK